MIWIFSLLSINVSKKNRMYKVIGLIFKRLTRNKNLCISKRKTRKWNCNYIWYDNETYFDEEITMMNFDSKISGFDIAEKIKKITIKDKVYSKSLFENLIFHIMI